MKCYNVINKTFSIFLYKTHLNKIHHVWKHFHRVASLINLIASVFKYEQCDATGDIIFLISTKIYFQNISWRHGVSFLCLMLANIYKIKIVFPIILNFFFFTITMPKWISFNFYNYIFKYCIILTHFISVILKSKFNI